MSLTLQRAALFSSIGADESLDPDAVAFALTFQDTLDAGRQRGTSAPPPGKTPADNSAQARLPSLSGRRPG